MSEEYAATESGRPSTTAEDFLVREQRTVLLVGEIDEWSARKTMFSLYSLVGEDRIHLVINSPGGSVFDGHAIYDTIRRMVVRGNTVEGYVAGHAMSIAVFPLLACSHRVMSTNAMLMVHGMESFKVGDVRDMEADADGANKILDIQARMLAERSNCSFEYWRDILKVHTPQYMTAGEALSLGLVDEVRD